MPNHCANQLTVKGPADQVSAFRERARGEKEVFDLNEFIPMPDEFRGTEDPSRDPKVVAELTEKYGAPDCHTWTAINWGTKWGAYESEVHDEGGGYVTYLFYTAWGPFGQDVLAKLSKDYPETILTLAFAERLMDFWGVWDAMKGEIVGESGGDEISTAPSEVAEDIELLASISG